MATISEEQHRIFTEAFLAFADENQTLRPLEITKCMRSLGHMPTAEEFKQIVDEFDVYGAGGLTVQNFLFVMARRECNTKLKQSLVNAFQLFDKDGNGFIGVEELKELMTTYGESPYTEEEWIFFTSELEPTPDGRLDYMKFVEILSRKEIPA